MRPRRTARSRSPRAAEEEPALERLLVEIERRTRAHPPLFAARTVLREAYWYFRRHGFPHWDVPVHVGMQQLNQLVTLPAERLRTTVLGYHIADTYHPHRLATRVHGAATPLESFFDDRRLRLALALMLRYGDRIGVTLPSPLKLVHGTQAAANFRPGYALYLYRRYLPREEGTILDTSAGFGGRLVAAICLPRAHYLGVDPCVQTHEGNLRLARDYGVAHRVTLLCQPIEEVDCALYRETCALAVTSPPYFRKEQYSDEATQSWRRYPRPEQWRIGFLRQMFAAQMTMLARGAYSLVNIADVTIGRTRLPLVEWAIAEAAHVGFTLVDQLTYPLTGRFGPAGRPRATEPVLVFRKPATGSRRRAPART